ncbi:ThrRS/AlaRS common domain-containing protein [Trematosphaeria pertusa]|uniref:ThrRS/AlaRS common domain-containing protein n=1 Tax=Trematosphaeria pertusa TaxID=390896 RepID=A0A6A6IWW4_9PLEO|nr:ThrRS/AlaRS common domain-containing protein [Trematosphaeria pertusa]KAF2254884.1 ThrRS/AlaRS common domain-containing protein [Trematosphaeria pertusa]
MAVAEPIPSIVGALSCQKDSYLRSLETEVVSCTEYVAPKTQKTNGKSKSTKSPDPGKAIGNGEAPSSKTWLIEFADSVLFPEGGGQPTDHGSITPLTSDPSGAIPITSIQRHGLRCVHLSSQPLEPGTRVQQDVDFNRRWDHMQQHTGQHLLSAIMDTMSLPTLSWSMGAAGEMNYIELLRKPSDEELRSIQQRCNEAIRTNMPITVETPGDAAAHKLPGDYDKEKGVVRFIKIGDLDYNACCGTHLKQTSHIGVILLHHMQSVRGTNCRLFFSAGDRAIQLATESINSLRNIAVSLSSGSAPADVQSSVQRLSDSFADARKKEKKMLAEIAKYEGDRIKADLAAGKKAWCYRATDGLDYINLVVFEVKEAVKERGVVVFASGEVKTAGSIVIIGEKGLVESMATKVKELVSTAKGGGKGEKWQGKVTEWRKGEIEALKAAVEGQ